MIYSLKCGNCFTDNNVSAIEEPIVWECKTCVNENSSSLPCSNDRKLILDPLKTKSLLSTKDSASAKNVIFARKLFPLEEVR